MRKFADWHIVSIALWLLALFLTLLFIAPLTYNSINISIEPTIPSTIDWEPKHKQTIESDLVFTNPNGELSSKQLQKIESKVELLKVNRKKLGISSITSPAQNQVTRKLQISADKSVLVYKLNLDRNQSLLRSRLAHIYKHAQISKLKVNVTGQAALLVNHDSQVKHASNIVRNVLCITITIILGLYLRSILTAILGFLSMLSVYLLSIFSIQFLNHFVHIPITLYSDLAFTLISFGIFPIAMLIILRAFSNNLERDPTGEHLFTVLWRRSLFWLLPTVLTLSLTIFSKSSIFQAGLSIVISLMISWLLLFTLLPTLTILLTTSFFWPGPGWIFDGTHLFWRKSHCYTLKAPLITLFTLMVFTILFLRHPLNPNFDLVADSSNNNQAIQGQHAEKIHMGANHGNKISIYLKNKQQLTKSEQLSQIDQLTTKLQADKMIKNVYSLTQPTGTPLSTYYINHQLKPVNTSLTGNIIAINRIKKELKRSQKAFSQVNLNNLTAQVQDLTFNLNSNSNNMQQIKQESDSVLKRLNFIIAHENKAINALYQASNNDKNITELKDSINQFNQVIQLIQASIQNIGIVKDNSQILSQEQNIINKAFQNARDNQLKMASNLTQTINQLQAVDANLMGTSSYLKQLQQSGVTKTFYMPSTEFEKFILGTESTQYLSKDRKNTRIDIILANERYSAESGRYLQKLPQMITDQLQPGILKDSRVQCAGLQWNQLCAQEKLHHDLIWIISACLLSFLLTGTLILRSTYQIIFILLTTISSIAISLTTGDLLSQAILNVHLTWQAILLACFLGTVIMSLQSFAVLYQPSTKSTINFKKQISLVGTYVHLLVPLTLLISLILLITRIPTIIQFGVLFFLQVTIFNLIFVPSITAFMYFTYRRQID